jgi:hypothetical protein
MSARGKSLYTLDGVALARKALRMKQARMAKVVKASGVRVD